ncbi:hypothetical protein I2483_14410 [Sporosarcina sp. E16_3]|uniref:hypothetical protein n=1 Tax=Sporosarcina sp. E16_3 TaxID=2789293 RepID=UPI001A933361|nr:hypothetical protein [Sporosarcina sp. E16_3]MBO0602857.1 hypothetical protein [Sporosarcina sp. E16_3]
MKKSLLFAALLGSALLLGACGDSDKKDEPKTEEEKKIEAVENNLKEQGAVDKSETVKSEDDLKEEFSKEEGVTSVSIIVTEDSGGFVLTDFDVAEDMKEEKAGELAGMFAKKLKAKYPDYQIDVQARKNGEAFAQKAIE